MFNVEKINNDIKAISEEVEMPIFSYDEIHRENTKNHFNYDYQQVIDGVSRIHGSDMTKSLVFANVLLPLPYGEYEVNVGDSTFYGGATNYNGLAIFVFSKDDYQAKLHELAHSLVDKYEFLDDNFIDKLYAKDGKVDKKKDFNRDNYKIYTEELFADVFSYSALLLRTDNWKDFAKLAKKSYFKSILEQKNALSDKSKSYAECSDKFYTYYPALKEVIRRIYKLKKKNKVGEYLDENGNINAQKLGDFVEDIVLDRAYTPQNYRSFFEKRFNFKYLQWRWDALKTYILYPFAKRFDKNDKDNHLKQRDLHIKLEEQDDDKLIDFIDEKCKFKNDDERALYNYMQILMEARLVERIYHKKYDLGHDLWVAGINNGLSEDYIKHRVDVLSFNSNSDEPDQEEKDTLKGFYIRVNQIVEENKDIVLFNQLLKSKMSFGVAQEVYTQKEDDPDFVVDIKYNSLKNNADVINDLGYIIQTVDEFLYNYDKDNKVADDIYGVMADDILKMDSSEFKDNILAKIDLGWDYNGDRKRELKQEIDLLCNDVLSVYYASKHDEEFCSLLKEVKDYDSDEMLMRISGIIDAKEDEAKDKCGYNIYEEGFDEELVERVKSRSGSGNVYFGLKAIDDFVEKHEISGGFSLMVKRAFIDDEAKICDIEFWEKINKKYARYSIEGCDEFIEDAAVLGSYLSKNIVYGSKNESYREAKNTLASVDIVEMIEKCKELIVDEYEKKEKQGVVNKKADKSIKRIRDFSRDDR